MNMDMTNNIYLESVKEITVINATASPYQGNFL